MNNAKRRFTCYFCNKLIENETEMGHATLCSKVLVPCPFKCGSYIERANLAKHKSECNNNSRKSNADLIASTSNPVGSTNSLDRNGTGKTYRPNMQEDVTYLHRRFAELEARIASTSTPNLNNGSSSSNYVLPINAPSKGLDEIKSTLEQHSRSIQKANYFNGFLSEWKKNIDAKVTSLKSSITSIENIQKQSEKQCEYIQEKLINFQNLQMDLNLLKATIFKENSQFKKTEMDFARNLEEIRSTFNQQNISFENMWRQQADVIQHALENIQDVRESIDEYKAKFTGLVFDLRSVSQIASEAAERIEIVERDFRTRGQEFNQMKVNMEILEDLTCKDSVSYKKLIWRITEVESKLRRAKENDIVLKSPIFYTHRYGYKIRVLLYINGLKKWKDRYALACIHVLKGEYDPLLIWPCVIEGNITLRNLDDKTQTKNFTKHIKVKRTSGDEEEDDPQESSSTYIFIPHSILFKDSYTKDDTFFLDISINDNNLTFETSL